MEANVSQQEEGFYLFFFCFELTGPLLGALLHVVLAVKLFLLSVSNVASYYNLFFLSQCNAFKPISNAGSSVKFNFHLTAATTTYNQ